MRMIQLKATVAEDRKLLLQLPQDIEPGEHELVVVIDPGEPAASVVEETDSGNLPVRREGNVLVYDGTAEGPEEDILEQVREERIERFLKQAQP